MKKIYILPNLVTTANLVCGFLAIVHSFKGEFTFAAWFIVIGAICDSLDGRIARMARATSPFGVQYDSLSDLASFGIAPAVLIYAYATHELNRFGVSAAAFYAVCGALRLARFNVGADETDLEKKSKIRRGYFQGLPSPASAGLIVCTVLAQSEFQIFSDAGLRWFMSFLSLSLALLMVSSIPFPSFKEVNWRAKGRSWILLVPVIAILFVIQAPEVTLFLIGYSYLILSLAWALYISFFRDKKQGVPLATH